MKRWFVSLLVLGLALAMAAPAASKPQPPTGGKTCAEAKSDGSWPGDIGTASGDFFVVAPPDQCFDVVAGAGNWGIDVTVAGGTVRQLTIALRDSVAPGDLCGLIGARRLGPGSYHFDLTGPESVSDICGPSFPDGDPELAFLVFMRPLGMDVPTVTVHVNLP